MTTPVTRGRVKGSTKMYASVGDRLIVHGLHVGDVERDGEILEVRGQDGGPPFVVRWSDSGHEGMIYPGADAVVQHFKHPAG